jgi:hypothetical protein
MVNYAGFVNYKDAALGWKKKWTEVNDIAISPKNKFWKIDRRDMKTYMFNDSTSAWDVKGIVTKKMNVGPYNTWTVDKLNKIKKYDGASWTDVTGNAQEIGVGSDQTEYTGEYVFIISTTVTGFEGRNIQKLVSGSFANVDYAPGNPMKIDVDYMGHAWVTDIWGYIHHYTGKEWLVELGNGHDVRHGIDDKVWIVNPYGQ